MRIPEDIPADILQAGSKYLGDDWYLAPVACDSDLEWRVSMAHQEIELIYDNYTSETPSLSEEDQKKVAEFVEELGACMTLREFIRTLPAWNGGWPTEAEIDSG